MNPTRCVRDHLRAGVAIYNAGAYRAAHGAWESKWLSLDRGGDDERFLHGLIQFTAAVHHARDGNDSGAVGLARSARSTSTASPTRITAWRSTRSGRSSRQRG